MDTGPATSTVRALVEEHYEFLYRFAYRLTGSAADAEDLTQQTFLTACRKWQQIEDLGAAKGWLATTLRRLWTKSLARNGETEFSRFEWIPDPVDPASQHDTPFDEEQLQATLLEMPETFRLPVLMFYFEDLSYQEIAERLEVPIGTVMSRLSRGKAFLRDRLRDSEPNNIANAKQRSPSPGPAPTETVKPFES